MNKSALLGAIFGIALATAAAGFAGYALMTDDPGALPSATRQDCYETQVQQPAEPKDEHRIAGTAIGALVGGAVGKDLGDRDITTAVGAAAGALAGNQVQKKIQERRTVTGTETRCEPADRQ